MSPTPWPAADWIRGLSADALPGPVVHQLKRTVLDGLGAAIAGTRTEAGRVAAAFASLNGRHGKASVLAAGVELTAPNAILSNVIAANAWDIDDGFRPSKGHPGGFVIMPALAAAQEWGSDRLLTGVAVGYEIACRTAIATHRYYHHYHASGSWGALGTAALLAHMDAVHESVLRSALGLAEYHAALSPIERCLSVPAMTKDAIGWGAYAGACAAHLARLGFTGNPSLLESDENTDLMADLGSNWHVLKLYFKPYPCCRWAQQGVEGILELRREHGLTPDDIESIRLVTFREATLLQQTPPRNTEEAQYNLFWPMAAALAHGTVTTDDVADENLNNPALAALVGRMSAVVDQDIQGRFPAEALGRVEVTCKDGRVVQSAMHAARGDAHIPLTDDELEAKFHQLVAPLVGELAPVLVDVIWQLEDARSAAKLVALLPDAGRRIAEALSTRQSPLSPAMGVR